MEVLVSPDSALGAPFSNPFASSVVDNVGSSIRNRGDRLSERTDAEDMSPRYSSRGGNSSVPRSSEGAMLSNQNRSEERPKRSNELGTVDKRLQGFEELSTSSRNSGKSSLKRNFDDDQDALITKRMHGCDDEFGAGNAMIQDGVGNECSQSGAGESVDISRPSSDACEMDQKILNFAAESGLVDTINQPTLRSEQKISNCAVETVLVDTINQPTLRSERNGETRGNMDINEPGSFPTSLHHVGEGDVTGLQTNGLAVRKTGSAGVEITGVGAKPSTSQSSKGCTEENFAVADVNRYQASEVNGEDFGDNVREIPKPRTRIAPWQDAGGAGPSCGRNDSAQDRQYVELTTDEDSDDDELLVIEGEMNGFGSDGSSTKATKPFNGFVQQRSGPYDLSASQSTIPSNSESDSDDCVVLDSRPPDHGQLSRGARVKDEESDETSDESESEMELVGDTQSDIRRMWEEAAMRRRMGRAMQSEESKVNGGQEGTTNLDEERAESPGMVESVATSMYHCSPDSKELTESSEAKDGSKCVVATHHSEHGASSMSMGQEQTGEKSSSMIHGACRNASEVLYTSKAGCSEGATGGGIETEQLHERDCRSMMSNDDKNMEVSADVEILLAKEPNIDKGRSSLGCDQNIIQESPQLHNNLEESGNEVREQQGMCSFSQAEVCVTSPKEDLLAGKERLKESLHYKNAQAAEWASRSEEIQRQSIEARKLVQRKKLEADRKKETERKQKERVDELRLSQQKEERNTGLKERIRVQVRAELDQIASSSDNFVTVLRQLGIPVDGGNQPTPQQVKDAYKTALKKFHPDRVGVITDPRHQVEAEERCKLILRLKKAFATCN